ncbi:MAG: helix-turn-helix transcriptional regulator [Acidimicrobiales bacterium]|nr:helix-turn-helix transcriptional regulator [Acidimicrobiales bacterium]MYG62682.1 helix-turn-helix transcriptional regulator [Acidimicrobiales bacterium]MYJ46102.1 helix-turn-helix transcriptional regulator [Acidimicrobiales bacterium]
MRSITIHYTVDMATLATRVVRTPGSLASAITGRRDQLGLTQQALADTAGVSRKLVCDAEAGKLTIQLDGLVKICTALGCELVMREVDPARLGYDDALAPLE